MSKYVIGVDYGTLSARAVVVDVLSGQELASAAMDYPHAVMSDTLPDGTKLAPDTALQHPQDYLDCMGATVREAVKLSGIQPEEVIGLGIDFTCSTVLPIDAQGKPLCLKPEFASDPHAYVKLWKHHAAEREAQAMTAAGDELLACYGGKASSEWTIPKIWETLHKSPAVCDAADSFIEAGDWLVLKLTGCDVRSASSVGYKAFWDWDKGFPTEWLNRCDPALAKVVAEKQNRTYAPVGTRAGGLDAFGAALTGLLPGTAVAVFNIDSHVALPAAGITDPGIMLLIIGTSTCHLLLTDSPVDVPGICGYVKDGMVPGTTAYEAGQSCVGDHFAWMVRNCCPPEYFDRAKAEGLHIQSYLTKLAEQQQPGESGLLALDWWNGNRSVLADYDLTGMMLGMTLSTRPEEIYRALIEATAYGTRMIVENFRQHGVRIDEIRAGGGIAKKNPFMMQVYADVLGCPVGIVDSDQAPALGSAMFAAVAAGTEAGGYATIQDAAKVMGKSVSVRYEPDPKHKAAYDALYAEYVRLHDYFGRGENDVMKHLKRLRAQAVSGKEQAE